MRTKSFASSTRHIFFYANKNTNKKKIKHLLRQYSRYHYSDIQGVYQNNKEIHIKIYPI